MRIEADPKIITDLEWHGRHLDYCQRRIDLAAQECDFDSVIIWQEILAHAEDCAEKYIAIMSSYIRVIK